MRRPVDPLDRAKCAAALKALSFVRPDTKIGLGTGSTASWFVELLGEQIRTGRISGIVGVPTSVRTGELAQKCGIALSTLDKAGWLDLTVDGADEFDPDLQLIKGAGGALLQEKIVATSSDQMIVIADPSKQVEELGAFPLPVEIVPFAWETTKAVIEDLVADLDVDECRASLRLKGDEPYVTDENHFIIDLHLGRIGDAEEMAGALTSIPGVVESGLFIDTADIVIIGKEDGEAEVLELDVDEEGEDDEVEDVETR